LVYFKARQNLLDGINAINELKREAQENKREVAQALQQINELEKDKESLSEELEAIRTVIRSDVEAFRNIARVPTKADIRRESYIGLVRWHWNLIVFSPLGI